MPKNPVYVYTYHTPPLHTATPPHSTPLYPTPLQEKGFSPVNAKETDTHRSEVKGRGGDPEHRKRLREALGGHSGGEREWECREVNLNYVVAERGLSIYIIVKWPTGKYRIMLFETEKGAHFIAFLHCGLALHNSLR